MKNSITRVDALNMALSLIDDALCSTIDATDAPKWDAAVEVIKGIRDSIAKQNAHKPEHKTPTKTQVANEGYKAEIIAYLSNGEHKTVSEIIKGVASLNNETTQKVSALMRLLKLEGKVDKEVVKGKTLFYLI
jgi:hypothetical protein